MPLHIPIAVAGINIDSYSTESLYNIWIPFTEILMDGMEIAIVNCKAGDRLIITFNCTLTAYAVATGQYGRFAINVNGVKQGVYMDAGIVADNTYYAVRHAVSMNRIYEIPAGGSYTVTVTWVQVGDGFVHYRDFGTRTLNIAHIKG